MDIDGFGTKLVDQLVDTGIINNVADIFHLNLEQLSKVLNAWQKNQPKISWMLLKQSKSTYHGPVYSWPRESEMWVNMLEKYWKNHLVGILNH